MVSAGMLQEVVPRAQRVQEYGPGERAALNVTVEHPEWFLLLDDRRSFEEAVRLGLRVVCTPVLAAMLCKERVIGRQEVTDVLARLAALGTVSPRLVGMAMALLQSAEGAGN